MRSECLAAFASRRASVGGGWDWLQLKFKGSARRDLSPGCGLITHEKAALSARGGQVSTFLPFMLPELASHVWCQAESGLTHGKQRAWSVSAAWLSRRQRQRGSGQWRRLTLIIRNLQQTQIRALGNALASLNGLFHEGPMTSSFFLHFITEGLGEFGHKSGTLE